MLPFVVVDSARLPDGTEFTLARRGREWVVRVGGSLLMSSRQHVSERALAARGLEVAPHARRVLVGGLGLGFTLREVLDRLVPEATVTVSELLPALVVWHRDHLGALCGRPLDDERVNVIAGDVYDVLSTSAGAFDLVLLDVDNGPVALSNPGNRRLYTEPGVLTCLKALKPSGVLAVWSRGPDQTYERTLRSVTTHVDVVQVRVGKGRAQHVLFLARAQRSGAQ